MSITIEGFAGKIIWNGGDYKVCSFFPTQESKEKVKVNEKYNNISISGLLPTFLEKVKYTIDVEETVGKYPNSYKLIRIHSNKNNDENYKDAFLKTILTENQYNTMTKAYPNILDLIINDKPIDCDKLHGIGEKSLEKIKDKVKQDYILIELIGKYGDLGLTMNGLKKLYDTYKSVAMIDEKMGKDAYGAMVCIAGMGFKKADMCLLKKFPNLINSPTRCIACASYILSQNELSGNTWISLQNLYRQVIELAPEASNNFESIIKDGQFFVHIPTKRVSLKQTYICEREVCKKLLEFNSTNTPINIDSSKYTMVGDFPLTNEQCQIMKDVCENNLCILTGSAGCGKTFSTKALINMLEDSQTKYILLSPTGRASKVLSENTSRQASTIHRGLGYNPKYGFLYNSENPLPYDVIIIDEFSMIDIFLMRSLLRAIKPTSKIVFIGDSAQLPSVSAGNCAFDMLTSDIINTSSLTQIFRYTSGGLSYVATESRNGNYFIKSKDQIQVYGDDKDYIFVNTNETIKVMKTLYNKIIREKNAKPEDIIVLTAYNKGEYGTLKVNKELQEMINPSSPNKKEMSTMKDKEKVIFREGDIVMQIKNNYKAKNSNDEDCQVFNGDMGKIVEIDDKNVSVLFDDNIIKYNSSQLNTLVLAYSATIHKMQGSSIKYVILLTPSAHKFFLNRNLLYVGLTRARELLYHISDFSTLKLTLKKSESLKRDTFLQEMLEENI